MTMQSPRRLASRDNPLFKTLRRLAESGRARRDAGLTFIDGAHLVEACLRRAHPLQWLVLSDTGLSKPDHRKLAAQVAEDRIVTMPDALFARLAPVDSPTGILGVIPVPQDVPAPESGADCVLLDAIQDDGNLGSILRSVAASGMRQVFVSSGCARVWSPRVMRAGMGAHFSLVLHEDADLPAVASAFPGTVVATVLGAPLSLFDAPLAGPVAWVFGNEGRGVSPPLAALAAMKVEIPMPGREESLNVAAAASICLFETIRQRRSNHVR